MKLPKSLDIQKVDAADIVKRACAHFNYQWPASLTSGVMFFEGQRITIEQFNKCARMFK